MSSDLGHTRSALGWCSPPLRRLLGEVLDVAERDVWESALRSECSPAGALRMRVALEALDEALVREEVTS